MRTGDQGVLRLMKGGDRLLTTDRRKVLEEFAERIAGFEIVDQRLQRHTGAHEHGSASHDRRVTVHNRLRLVGHRLALPIRIPPGPRRRYSQSRISWTDQY